MKTAISVPDSLYERVERLLASTGQSRSAFFAEAAEQRLAALERNELTAQIDMVVADARDAVIVEYNPRRLSDADTRW